MNISSIELVTYTKRHSSNPRVMPKTGFISFKDSIFSSTFQKVFNRVEAFPKLRGPFDLRPKKITMLHVLSLQKFKPQVIRTFLNLRNPFG
jgi:hypothetical protein